MLGEKYKELYEDYYDDKVETKRHLTAIETMTHIHKLVGNTKFESVIDVGAGQGSLLELMAKEALAKRIVGLEISQSGIDRINSRKIENVEVYNFDGYKINFADKEFDLALSIHVLEHVEHERMLLREISRISKQAIIEIPLEHTYNLCKNISIMERFGHINFYTKDRFANLLKTSGLIPRKVMVNTYSLDLDRYLDPKFGTLKNKIRKAALDIAPGAAQSVFVYLCTALCDCE